MLLTVQSSVKLCSIHLKLKLFNSVEHLTGYSFSQFDKSAGKVII